MCAIFGVFFIKGDYARCRKQVIKMIKRLQARGPDATGIKHYCMGGNVHHFIGHQRLSIVDPFHGDQPFYGNYKKTCSVTNGEIYNHLEVNPYNLYNLYNLIFKLILPFSSEKTWRRSINSSENRTVRSFHIYSTKSTTSQSFQIFFMEFSEVWFMMKKIREF